MGVGEREGKEAGGKARREHREICTRTVKNARRRSKDGKTKRNKQKRQDRKGSSERQCKRREIKKD